MYLVEFHETFLQPLDFIPIDCRRCQRMMVKAERARRISQLDPWIMLSSNWLLEPILLRASYSAAWFADATFAMRTCVDVAGVSQEGCIVIATENRNRPEYAWVIDTIYMSTYSLEAEAEKLNPTWCHIP